MIGKKTLPVFAKHGKALDFVFLFLAWQSASKLDLLIWLNENVGFLSFFNYGIH